MAISDTNSVATNIANAQLANSSGQDVVTRGEANAILAAARSDGVISAQEVRDAHAAVNQARARFAEGMGISPKQVTPALLHRLASASRRDGDDEGGRLCDMLAGHLQNLQNIASTLTAERSQQSAWTNIWH